MYTILTQIVLFFTAATAGRVCASKGFRLLGVCAFVVLETGYLTLFFGNWWIGLILMLTGLAIVLRCQRRASNTTSDMNATN